MTSCSVGSPGYSIGAAGSITGTIGAITFIEPLLRLLLFLFLEPPMETHTSFGSSESGSSESMTRTQVLMK